MNTCHDIWVRWRKFIVLLVLITPAIILINNSSQGPIIIRLQNPVAVQSRSNELEYYEDITVKQKPKQAPTIANDAKIFNNYRGCPIKSATVYDDFYDYLQKPLEPCKNMVQVGGRPFQGNKAIDGDKWICFDDDYQWKRGNCHVISLGINNEWSFDDTMDKTYGCKVYAFDPTMKAKAHNRSENIQFYPIGLAEKKMQIKIKNSMSELDTYENLIKMLHLENTVIDYLKMDIEGYEMNFFNDVLINKPELFSKINQFGLEVHQGYPNKNDNRISENSYFNKMYMHMQRLECLGYKLIAVHKNIAAPGGFFFKGDKKPCCYEIVYGKKPV